MSIEQMVREVLRAAIEDDLIRLHDDLPHGVDGLTAGDLVHPANVLSECIHKSKREIVESDVAKCPLCYQPLDGEIGTHFRCERRIKFEDVSAEGSGYTTLRSKLTRDQRQDLTVQKQLGATDLQPTPETDNQ